MFITPTDIGDISTIVAMQKSNANPGPDSNLPKVIFNCITHIAHPL